MQDISPKDKAYELFIFYYKTIKYGHINKERDAISKVCAMRVVDEILNSDNDFIQTNEHKDYWLEVKEELNKFI